METPQIEIIIFRYVSRDQRPSFVQRMADWRIPLLDDKRELAKNGQPAATAPERLWDYPSYDPQELPVEELKSNIQGVIGGELFQGLTLGKVKYVFIADEKIPDHFPYAYTLSYHFVCSLAHAVPDRTALLRELRRLTGNIKRITEVVTPGADYRPVYWFLTNCSPELIGLSGNIIAVTTPDGKVSGKIERGFPNASYILYDFSPSQHDIRIPDLGFVSVVPHAAERGYRAQLDALTQNISNAVREVHGTAAEVGKQQRSNNYRAELERIISTQARIRPEIDAFYSVRRRLIRSRGLVQRVRQICGSEDASKPTFFDIICDDAVTMIEDEVAMSLDEITISFKEINDRLINEYNRVNAERSQNLQKLGYFLQSTGVSLLAFEVITGLWEVPSNQTETDVVRILTIIAVTILAGVITYALLRVSFRNQ